MDNLHKIDQLVKDINKSTEEINKLKPENNPMSPGYVSVNPWNGDQYTGD